MNLFTRREVFVSTSFEKAAQMRAKIQSGSVECMMSCKNHNCTRDSYSDRLGKNMIEYRLFVHKRDVEFTISLMNKAEF